MFLIPNRGTIRSDAQQVATGFERRIFWRSLTVNLIVVGLTVLYGVIAVPRPAGSTSRLAAVPVTVLAAGTFFCLCYLGFALLLHRRFSPIARWLSSERPLDEAERALVFELPWWIARTLYLLWVVAAAIEVGVNLTYYPLGRTVASLGAGILLAGLIACTLCFLIVERAMRPLFVQALLADPTAQVRSARVLQRLILSWCFSAGAYFLFAFLGPFVLRDPSQLHQLRVLIAFNSALGIVVGLVVIIFVGRSLTDRLEALSEAQRRVERGDLAAHVAVDERGELGLLLSGFNRMVAGLRERERLHDLFGRHVGTEVAKEALLRDGRLGGELAVASVLFVDVIGSTALAHERPPTEVVSVLNAFFEAVVRIAAVEGGWVNKFEGDAALCAFGVPNGGDDHAERALRTARKLRRELEPLRAAYPGFDVAIGVSTGEVVAGNIGSEVRYEYTLVGDPVNEAARLTEEAKRRPGRVLASGAALRAAGGEADCWVSTGLVMLRGRSSPTESYEPASIITQRAG